MRIPFSVFLMPIYWFALLDSNVDWWSVALVFIILHLLVYPASNGYNSYFDRDEKSIGGLKSPPKVTRELWYLVIAFDLIAVLLALTVNLIFAVMVAVYLLVSKAYSYDKIRLKRYPVLGALTVIIFQGFFTFLAVRAGTETNFMLTPDVIGRAAVSSLFLLGSYPMTQIYQHEEDAAHGDLTLSMMLGINGTFIFSSVIFFISTLVICFLFYINREWINILVFLTVMLPVGIYFMKWHNDFRKKGREVITFERTMRLNAMSSLLLSVAFILMLALERLI